MEESHRSFTGSIPENYERHLVPLIFADYAERLVASLGLGEGGQGEVMELLETACGTGVVTRRIVERLVGRSQLIATDFNEPMLEQARKAVGDTRTVAFRQADALDLPFKDGSFDAVVCQFGVMFFPDRIKGYREALRVLKPGGRLVFSVWDSLDQNLFAKVVHETLARLYPEDPPRFLETPFGYYDLRLIVAELQEAGFGQVDISAVPLVSAAETPRDVAFAYCAGGPVANDVAARATLSLEQVVGALAGRKCRPFRSPPSRRLPRDGLGRLRHLRRE